MRTRRLRILALCVASALVSPAVLAQGQGGGGGGGGGQQQGGGQQSMRPDMTPQMQQQMNKDMSRAQEQARRMQQQKNLRQQQLGDDDLYGQQMMSAQERDRFRQQLGAAKSDKEWAELRAQHQKEMQARAKERGVDMEPPVYGQHMMTATERQQFQQRMQAANNDAERARIREEHREMIRERADALGMPAPPVEN